MSQATLKKLTIEYLRGSVSPFVLTFEKGKTLTIVYGENASGKSTICDAFEFLGKGKVGSLEKRGLGKTNRYWHSIGKQPADVAVTLDTANTTCRAKIVKGDVVVDPAGSRPRVEVLRRSQILALIEADPADRYAEVSRFIDVTGVETSENSLRALIRDMEGSRNVAIARIQENRDAITQFWTSAGKSGNDALRWAEIEAARDPNASDAELSALAKLQAAYARLGDYPDRLKTANAAVQTAASTAASAQVKADEQLQTIAKDAGELVGVLEAARTYLQKHSAPSVCPLCESAEKVDGLSQRIAQRLVSFSALQAARNHITVAVRSTQQAEQLVVALRESAKKHAEEFEQSRLSFKWSTDIEIPAGPAPPEIDALSGWLATTTHLSASWKKAETTRVDKKQFTKTLKVALKTYVENVAAQKVLDILLPKLNKTLEIVEEERRSFTDGVLAKIAGEVGRIYEEVHPGEGLDKISLELDPKRRASLSISASFCGQTGTQPQAYFSDSHLDTLGLCVFLALAAMDEPESTILVLDDVLASVDEPHVERLIEVLYAEALKFRHCVITTHYRPWRTKLRWGWIKSGQCQFVEMGSWSSQTGMKLVLYIPEVERLRALLAVVPPDTQSICAKAGVILEAALDFLTQLYECRVPRRANGLYTLGDLLPSIDKKLRQVLCVDVKTGTDASGVAVYQRSSLAPILDELERIAQARNVFGCHFNTLSFDLLDSDAVGFGQQVLLLMDTLVDVDVGWPRNKKSGSYWATAGETRRLHPLERPG